MLIFRCLPDALKLLIDRGVDLNKKTKSGYTDDDDAECDINIQV